jgi:hypothetical protein
MEDSGRKNAHMRRSRFWETAGGAVVEEIRLSLCRQPEDQYWLSVLDRSLAVMSTIGITRS